MTNIDAGQPHILPPTGSDLYPTPDERAEIEKIIGPWETYDSEAGAPIHKQVRTRALKAFRAGYALREEGLRGAYDRGYAAAEDAIGDFDCDCA